jgi:hypothetical protein
MAQVVARVRQVPVFLTDGWKAYRAALLQVVGIVYRPRRRGTVGRKPKPRLVAPKDLFYAQVQSPGPGRPRGRGQHARGLRRAAPLLPAVAPAAVGGDDSDGLYGAMVWDTAGLGRSVAPPHALPLLVSLPPSGAYLVAGQSL